MKVIFMGTADFAAHILQDLVHGGHDVLCAVSQPDRSKNRGKKMIETPVKAISSQLGIEVLQPERIKKNNEFLDILKSYNPDVIVVAAYGKMLSREILDLPAYGCINVHASLLPRHRGAAPIQWAVYSGDEKTGVTIMQMAEGMDTGDMLKKRETLIGRKNSEELFEELASIGGKLLLETLSDIESGDILPEKQDESLATEAPMISKKDGEVDWTKSAVEIERMIRAFYPWPGTYTMYGEKQLKIWKADVLKNENLDLDDIDLCTDEKYGTGKVITSERVDIEKCVPGKVICVGKDSLVVDTGEGKLSLREVQMPGKKKMKIDDFLRGNKIEISTILG